MPNGTLLIDPSTILMPLLHIKLSLIKQFVKALDRNSEAFKYLQNFFSKLSETKIKADAFLLATDKKNIGVH